MRCGLERRIGGGGQDLREGVSTVGDQGPLAFVEADPGGVPFAIGALEFLAACVDPGRVDGQQPRQGGIVQLGMAATPGIEAAHELVAFVGQGLGLPALIGRLLIEPLPFAPSCLVVTSGRLQPRPGVLHGLFQGCLPGIRRGVLTQDLGQLFGQRLALPAPGSELGREPPLGLLQALLPGGELAEDEFVALEGLAEDFTQRHGIALEAAVDGLADPPRLPAPSAQHA